jgi:para-nitrobenzyl esterase
LANEAEAAVAQSSRAISRRAALKGSALVIAAGAASAVASTVSAQGVQEETRAPEAKSVDSVVARAGSAVVSIESGVIAGYIRRGIFAFKGIPYGNTTAGEHRFAAPRKPQAWTGIRSSRQFGYVAPQDKGTGRLNDEEAFMFQWNDCVEGEDCLRINVWTPGINDNRRRPVMVWLHGGGFVAGSGHDLPAFDGENLARRGDVVVATVNHRLNSLGFLDLSRYSDRYAQSGNVGMLDIVAALEWVRENIAQFGGDSRNVLIFGQSGGGAKVSTLMGMPSARGLFHRAIVESGSFTFSNTQEKSQRLADQILSELQLRPATIDRLHALPYADLRRAGEAALRSVNPPMGSVLDVRDIARNLGFGPVVDGKVLPVAPFSPAAPEMSADVPMIVGTTLNEFVTAMNHPEYELMTEAELESKTDGMFPGRAAQIVAAFRRRTPEAKPFDLWSRIASSPVREAAIRQATAKSALNKAPAYLYWFTWQTPIFDGRPRAFHCAEMPFVFCNTDRCDTMTGGGLNARTLSARMADAWIQFARTGDPNHAAISNWSPFYPGTASTMIFDNDTRQVHNPDSEEQESISDA